MQYTCEHVLPAPIERVEKMYWDFAFAPRKCGELGLKEIEVVSTKNERL